MLLGSINVKLKRLITKFRTPFITTKTIFARNYGTPAVISYNLKGIAPPVPPVQCWANKNLMSGYAAPTLKRVGGGTVENMYQEMVCYNRMHVKTRLSQSTIFARNYGTAAVISYNLKGIAPPFPQVQCWIDKNLMSGCEAPTLKRVGGGRVGKMYQ